MEKSFSKWLVIQVKTKGIMWKCIAEELSLAPDRITYRIKKDSFTYNEEIKIKKLLNNLITEGNEKP